MKASSPHATSLSARQTHEFIVVTCGLLVCCGSKSLERGSSQRALLPQPWPLPSERLYKDRSEECVGRAQ
jgi:hypothetical protein